MKRIITLFLCLAISLCTLSASVCAETGGDGNIDGGGGDMGSGTGENFWNPGMDGVRVTVVRADTWQPVTTPIDLTNKKPVVTVHFGKVSKIHYRNGSALSPKTRDYLYFNPEQAMPRIISTDGSVNIDQIKAYFCSEYAIKLIAQCTGMDYDRLINGECKLLLEPVSYFTHNGVNYAFTAHEVALYDNQTSGALRKAMKSLTHKNQPLSMFLEYADLGFPAYTGATNEPQSNDTIIECLGLGIVRFRPEVPDAGEPNKEYEYRCDTDVITSVMLYTADEIAPDAPASVTFQINDSSYTVNHIVIPEGESQLVWMKWHTPSTPQDVTITVSTTQGVLGQTSIKAKVRKLSVSEPPDPRAADTKGDWSAAEVPTRQAQTTASWGVWSAVWQNKWVWHENWVWMPDVGKWVDTGTWTDEGWYKYKRNNYTVSLSVFMSLYPDDTVPTQYRQTMKSGYGVKNTTTAAVSTAAPFSYYTFAQTAVSYFPEFQYQTYWRILDCTTAAKTARFQFAQNPYSTYNRRVHFSPVWYPDGIYRVNTYIYDIWTPAGMLSASVDDSIRINGNLYDDWHIAPIF